MKYKLPDFDLSKFPKVFVENRTRWATATAVNYVSENLILVAIFLEKKIYLIKTDGFEIISEISTVNYPDLMDYKDGLIAISERSDFGKKGSIGLYTLNDNKLEHLKNVEFDKFNELHGVRVYDENKIIFTDKSKNKGIHILDLTNDEIYSFSNFDFHPCDIFLTNKDRILLVTSETKPNNGGLKNYTAKFSHLHLFEFPSFKELNKISFDGQTDCISYEDGLGFITIQNSDSLFHFKLEDDKLHNLGSIKKDFSFPHGTCMKNKKVYVTNYGTNTVDILDYNELIQK